MAEKRFVTIAITLLICIWVLTIIAKEGFVGVSRDFTNLIKLNWLTFTSYRGLSPSSKPPKLLRRQRIPRIPMAESQTKWPL
jgi:hypothetical protein